MKNSLLKFAAAALLASATIGYAIPDPDWDLSNLFNVNTLGAPTVLPGNINGDYKFEAGGTESGTSFLVNAFTTEISEDMFTVKTTWPSSVNIDINTIYLKAGNQYAAWNVGSIDWSLYDGFYVTQNAILNPQANAYLTISHETVNGGGNSVPDGGTTAVLLGLGLLGLGLLGRRKSALA